MEYNIKPTKPPRQEGGFPQTIPQLIQKYKLDSMWEEITKTVKDIIQQELGQKALKGTSLTVKGADGEEGFIQVLDKEDKPIVEINNSGVEVGEGKTITEGGSEVSKSVEWEDVRNKPNEFKPETHTHTKSQISDFTHTHSEYKQKSDFAIVSGTANFIDNTTVTIAYPSGFTASNCVILNCLINKAHYPTVLDDTRIELGSANITITQNVASTRGFKYNIILMKT